MFSKTCQYAIRAVAHIATQSKQRRRSGLADIAREIDAPPQFTAKILQRLVKDGIISSMKGPHGGFDMDPRSLKTVKLIQIVVAFDGDGVFYGCGLGLPECSASQPCPMHDKFILIRNDLRSMLQKTSVGEIADSLLDGLTCLRR